MAVWLVAAFGWAQGGVTTNRGVFPNMTHSQAMVGKATGFFEKTLGRARRSSGKLSTSALRPSRRYLQARST